MLFFSGVGLILDWSWSWTVNCLQLNDDLSKIRFSIINHFTWNDRWSISEFWIWIVHHPITNFSSKKLWCCEEFSSQPSNDAKIFLFIDNEKEIVDQLKYFSSLDEIFLRKIWGGDFSPKIEFWGGVKNRQNREKMGGCPLRLGGQSYYGKSGRSEETPPPKLQNWHGNKLEKRTWLGTTMEAFQWQTSYTNY